VHAILRVFIVQPHVAWYRHQGILNRSRSNRHEQRISRSRTIVEFECLRSRRCHALWSLNLSKAFKQAVIFNFYAELGHTVESFTQLSTLIQHCCGSPQVIFIIYFPQLEVDKYRCKPGLEPQARASEISGQAQAHFKPSSGSGLARAWTGWARRAQGLKPSPAHH